MIRFTPREADTAQTPPAGEYSLFLTTAGELALKDSEGGVILFAPVSDAEEPNDSDDLAGKQFLGGAIDGSLIGARNQVSISPPASVAAPGYRGMPTNPQNGAYTFQLRDIGICVPNLTGGWIIPANSAVPFPVDTIIMIENGSASPQTLAITTDTLTLAGGTSTGTRTLAANGVASIRKRSATEWLCWGNLT